MHGSCWESHPGSPQSRLHDTRRACDPFTRTPRLSTTALSSPSTLYTPARVRRPHHLLPHRSPRRLPVLQASFGRPECPTSQPQRPSPGTGHLDEGGLSRKRAPAHFRVHCATQIVANRAVLSNPSSRVTSVPATPRCPSHFQLRIGRNTSKESIAAFLSDSHSRSRLESQPQSLDKHKLVQLEAVGTVSTGGYQRWQRAADGLRSLNLKPRRHCLPKQPDSALERYTWRACGGRRAFTPAPSIDNLLFDRFRR